MAIIKVSIQNSEEVSVNVRTFLKGEPGVGSRLLNLKNYDPDLAVTKENYEILIVDLNTVNTNIQMPVNPDNGEHYKFIVKPNINNTTSNLVFAPKSFLINGVNQIPLYLYGGVWIFEIYWNQSTNLWEIMYTSQN